MNQYIGQITVILESDSPAQATATLCELALQIDDTAPDVVFADHNGEVEDYEEIEQECEASLDSPTTGNADQILAKIATHHLGIATLETRSSDSLDFHDVAVWAIHAALKAAYEAGSLSSNQNVVAPQAASPVQLSSRWTYGYNPYRVQRGDEPGFELPAFEIFDADGNKLFDTNEDMPAEVQEANARLAAAAPDLLAVLDHCAMLVADYDEHDGEECETYRDAIAVINKATAGKHNA